MNGLCARRPTTQSCVLFLSVCLSVRPPQVSDVQQFTFFTNPKDDPEAFRKLMLEVRCTPKYACLIQSVWADVINRSLYAQVIAKDFKIIILKPAFSDLELPAIMEILSVSPLFLHPRPIFFLHFRNWAC